MDVKMSPEDLSRGLGKNSGRISTTPPLTALLTTLDPVETCKRSRAGPPRRVAEGQWDLDVRLSGVTPCVRRTGVGPTPAKERYAQVEHSPGIHKQEHHG